VIAGATALAFRGVGDLTGGPGFDNFLLNVAGHALVGCGSSVASGGKCGPGALSAAVTAFAGPIINGKSFSIGSLIMNTTIGGLASVAGGGKFANGAMTAAFGYLFNQVQHRDDQVDTGRPLTEGETNAALKEYPDLNTDPIRIIAAMPGNAGYTPNNTMNVPFSMASCTDFSTCHNGDLLPFFIHEVGHVYQFQNGINPVAGFLAAGYDFLNPPASGSYFTRQQYLQTRSAQGLNTEQQADWHMWHYVCTYGKSAGQC